MNKILHWLKLHACKPTNVSIHRTTEEKERKGIVFSSIPPPHYSQAKRQQTFWWACRCWSVLRFQLVNVDDHRSSHSRWDNRCSMLKSSICSSMFIEQRCCSARSLDIVCDQAHSVICLCLQKRKSLWVILDKDETPVNTVITSSVPFLCCSKMMTTSSRVDLLSPSFLQVDEWSRLLFPSFWCDHSPRHDDLSRLAFIHFYWCILNM